MADKAARTNIKFKRTKNTLLKTDRIPNNLSRGQWKGKVTNQAKSTNQIHQEFLNNKKKQFNHDQVVELKRIGNEEEYVDIYEGSYDAWKENQDRKWLPGGAKFDKYVKFPESENTLQEKVDKKLAKQKRKPVPSNLKQDMVNAAIAGAWKQSYYGNNNKVQEKKTQEIGYEWK